MDPNACLMAGSECNQSPFGTEMSPLPLAMGTSAAAAMPGVAEGMGKRSDGSVHVCGRTFTFIADGLIQSQLGLLQKVMLEYVYIKKMDRI